MRRLAFTLSMAVGLLVAAAQAAPAAKDNWTSVRSQNFFLIGNAGEKDVRQVAVRLEQFREAFTRIFPAAKHTSPVPVTVVVFKSDGSYKPFKPVVDGKISDVAGYFQPGEDVNYITLTTEKRSENPYRTIYHEYVHLLVNNTLGRGGAPTWFNEGLAEYYSTFDVDDERKVTLGQPVANHVYLLREQPLIPLKTLFEIDNYALQRNKHDARGLFYAQSWALVHYLVRGEGGRRLPQMGKFFNLLLKKVPTEQAFREAFETDYAAMEKELKSYVRQTRFPIQLVTFDEKLEFGQGVESVPLTEAEAQAYLGDLLLHTDRADDAVARLEQALALDPNLARAHASLGMAHMRRQRFDDAKRHLRRAVAANADNYLAHYYYAYTLSREGMKGDSVETGYSQESAQEMRAALQRAIKLKPDFAESYRLLAWVNLVTGEQLDEGVELLRRALALAPGQESYSFILAQLHIRRQKYDEARKVLAPLAQGGSDPQLRANARAMLDSVSNYQEQLARFNAGRAAAESEGAAGDSPPPPAAGGEPRLRRRGEAGAPSPDAGKSDEELLAEANAQAVREALRKPLEGEVRVRALLARIDCGPKGVVFVFKAGDRQLRLHSRDFNDIQIIAFTTEAGSEITCGARKQESAAVVTYRPSKDAGSKHDGEIVALEFVPAAFELKP